MGISLRRASSIIQVEVAQSIIELTGGIDRFSDLTSEFFSEFLTEQEQFDFNLKSINEAFGELGVSLPKTRDEFSDLITGLNLLSDSDQKLYAGLLELVPALDNYYDTIEQREADRIAELEKKKEEEQRLLEEQAAEEQRILDEIKNERLSALQAEKNILQTVVNKFLPSAQASAISTVQALEAARRGDFSLAAQLSPESISTTSFGSAFDFAIAQAQQQALLSEIGELAQDQLTDTEMQIMAIEEGNVALLDAANDQLFVSQNQLEVLNEIKDQYNPAVMMVGPASQEVVNLSNEMHEQVMELQTQVRDISVSMARNIASIASNSDQLVRDGMPIRTEGDDILKVEQVG